MLAVAEDEFFRTGERKLAPPGVDFAGKIVGLGRQFKDPCAIGGREIKFRCVGLLLSIGISLRHTFILCMSIGGDGNRVVRRVRFWKVERKNDGSRVARTGGAREPEDGNATEYQRDAGSDKSESPPMWPAGAPGAVLPRDNLTANSQRCEHNRNYAKRAKKIGGISQKLPIHLAGSGMVLGCYWETARCLSRVPDVCKWQMAIARASDASIG